MFAAIKSILRGNIESLSPNFVIYTYGSKNVYTRTDTVFFPISDIRDGYDSLIKYYVNFGRLPTESLYICAVQYNEVQ